MGYKRSILIALVIATLAFLTLPFVTTFNLVYLLTFMIGFAGGMYLPSALPLITESFSEKVWGKAISIHDSASSISVFAVPLIAIFLLQLMPWRGVFYVMGGSFFSLPWYFTLFVTN